MKIFGSTAIGRRGRMRASVLIQERTSRDCRVSVECVRSRRKCSHIVRLKPDLLFSRTANSYATFARVLLIVLFGAVFNRSATVVFISRGRGFNGCTRLPGWQIERIREDLRNFLGALVDHSR